MKNHTTCRVCGCENLIPYLDLGMMPLSNNLANSILDPIHLEKYPLKVVFCPDCGLSQLSVVIEPGKLFGHYVYRSSISQGYKDHCREMAVDLKEKFNLGKDSFHIDIAGNDGALLSEFNKVIDGRILNIDPAENLAGICQAAGIPTLTFFWGMDVARRVVNYHGQADLITATNVFAHVDDVREFIEAATYVLKPDGHLVLEFPYLIDFIEGKEFDTIYFEHLSYFSIYPITMLCKSQGLEVLSVAKQDIHGGSVRVIIGRGEPDETVKEFVEIERSKYGTIEPYNEFAKAVKETIQTFSDKISRLKGTVAGFAASAKGNTLLNSAGITCGRIKYIVDQTPEKIGKYSPGTFIPIVSMDDMKRTPPDYLVVLSWNFADEIIDKCKQAGYKGDFIIPIPEFKVIKSSRMIEV
jgi:SAM-dependent methyltransferase